MNEFKVLIIDDTPQNVQLASNILKSEKLDINFFLDGKSALEYLGNNDSDLILLDIMMPVMDGFEICKILKNNEKTKEIPIIFLTANNDSNNIITGFNLGAVDYVTKPFNSQELKSRVKTHLELNKTKKELIEKNKDLKLSLEKVEILSRIDPLTEISNRRDILEKIEDEIERFKRIKRVFSLVIMDIDFFKNVNDTFGHNFGDYVLKSIANILKKEKRGHDKVARWGGEEFLIFLPETKIDGAMIFAERLRRIIENYNFEYNNNSMHITSTFGVSEYFVEIGIDELIKKSDDALYYGKESGRNKVVNFEQK